MTRTINRNNQSFDVYVNNEMESKFWTRYTSHEWEPEILDFYYAKKRKGVFLDIGSWIGPVSILMAQVYDKVYAVDFDPVAKEHFHKNIELNGIKNIVPISVGLSNKREKVKLDPKWFGSSETSLYYNSAKGVEVDMITFDDLIKSIPESKNISFIKIDIEGGEFKILSDVYRFIKYHPCITVISYHSFQLEKRVWKKFKFIHALKQLRFKKYFISSEATVEVKPYNFRHLIKSRFQLADALSSETIQ